VLQLVKMSAKTGTLTLRCEERSGRLFFRNGHIYYAFVDPQVMPLGERLVRAGAITPRQLEEALAAQRSRPEGTRLGTVLESLGFIDRGTLAEAISDQIEEAAFDLLGWLEGEFEFRGDAPPADEDIILELTVDGLIIDGCRRIDEWDLVMASLGSLQHIPRLEYAEGVSDHGGVSFSPEEWRVISLVDGRRDAGSVIRDCGMNRFRAAKVLRRLVDEGLAIMRPAAIEGLENAVAVVVRSPIDFYTEVFLSTLNEETLTRHLLVLNLDEQEVEVPMVAVTLPDEDGGDEQTLVFALGSGTHEPAWRELAGRSSAGILLVNANSADSVRASAADLAAAAGVEGLPLVVAVYVSVADEPVSEEVVRKNLALPADVPVLACELRDPDDVGQVLDRALQLAVRSAPAADDSAEAAGDPAAPAGARTAAAGPADPAAAGDPAPATGDPAAAPAASAP
jgi:hypothetical protein